MRNTIPLSFDALEETNPRSFIKFYLSSFRIIVKPEDRLVLPAYAGAALRGGFGWAFKNLVCIRKGPACTGCLIAPQCSYFRIFETPVPADAQMMRKYPFAPHPFVLAPPLGARREYSASDELAFSLTLIGNAAGFLPYCIYVFDELGRRGLGKPGNRYSLARVEDASGLNDKPCVYDGASRRLSDDFQRLDFSKFRENGAGFGNETGAPVVKIRFLTPAHLVRDGGIDHELKFSTVMASLLRRIRLLQYFHCLEPEDAQGELTLEETHRLLSLADQVDTMDKRVRWIAHGRKSGHSGAPMTLSGFTGEIDYRFPSQGALAALAPYLRLAEFIHIGKHTSFGCGKIQVDIDTLAT